MAFLSPEWLAELSQAAAAEGSRAVPADLSLTVRHVVRGPTGGEVAFDVAFAQGRITFTLVEDGTIAGGNGSPAPDVPAPDVPAPDVPAPDVPAPDVPAPDVEVVSDYDTAAAMSRGELSPATALATGRLRVGGRLGLLVEHHDALGRLGDLFAEVRGRTEYR